MTARVDGPYCAIHDAAHPPCDPLDAGVLSSDAPVVLSPAAADRVAALIEERPGPTEAMRALFAERRPCAGWVDDGDVATLTVTVATTGDYYEALIYPIDRKWRWRVASGITVRVSASVDSKDAAKLAAEDALLAVADEIRRAVGR